MIRPIKIAAAMTAVLGVASFATAPLVAARAHEVRRAYFELVAPLAKIGSPSLSGQQLPLASLAKATPADVRKQLQQMVKVPGALSGRADAWLRLLDVLDAKDSAERHERVLKLGVDVRKQRTDEGTFTSFRVRGVERVRTFRPTPAPVSPTETITSPDVANPAPIVRTDCVPENVYPEECATDQDIEDFEATLADLDAEAVANITDIENGYWGDDAGDVSSSGPSADERHNCVAEALISMSGWNDVRTAIGAAGASIFEVPAAQVTKAMLVAALEDLFWPVTLALAVTYILYKCAAEREPILQEPTARLEFAAVGR